MEQGSSTSSKKNMGRAYDYLPVFAMIGLQIILAGVTLFTRAALLEGLSPRVFIVYRQCIATLLMAPLALLSRRKNSSGCSLGLKSFVWIFLASLLGVTGYQNAYFEGLYYSSSTIASAMNNLVPAITFVMTAIIGLEKVRIRSLATLAKILGTLICVGGALFMTFYKGPKLLNAQLLSPKSLFSSGGDDWLLGCLLLLASSLFWSLWMVLQVPVSASCPDHLYSSTWMCFMVTIESAALALFVEKGVDAWRLNSYLEISCILYTGFALAASFLVQTWCISKKGPLFCAMFNPLCTVIVALFAAIFQHEETYTGCLVGAFAVIVGLYTVLWGKAKDLEEMVNVITFESSEKICKIDVEEPLLSDKSTNDADIGIVR